MESGELALGDVVAFGFLVVLAFVLFECLVDISRCSVVLQID